MNAGNDYADANGTVSLSATQAEKLDSVCDRFEAEWKAGRRPRIIDAALEAICLKAMARKPEDRYATPKELADDLERWMADEPVSAWSEPLATRARRWMRRHKSWMAARGVALVLVSAVSSLAAILIDGRAARRRLAC
jgi:hypothetical protein